ncbi:hypothetical protein [Streptomyces triticirhizae]|uniref:hypothetical protein n=1 Tax=Streptomyces triticirhizae TaxID=2483353 RepID=UPI0011C43352|nr:hypothetical protein [Streptomyces triticirhizae]
MHEGDRSLGYCAGHPEEEFDPEDGTAALREGGWEVTGPWVEVPADAPDAEEGQWAAPVVRIAPETETVL